MSRKWTLIWLTFIFILFQLLAVYSFSKNNYFFLLLSEVTIPVLFAITFWTIARSLKPIITIGKSLNLLREGDFNVTLVKTGNRDVDNIIDVYNSMINRLREERLSVREKNHFLDLLIDSSPLGIIVLDLDDRIKDINKAALNCMDLKEDNYKKQYLGDLKNKLANELIKIKYEEKQFIDRGDGQKLLCRKLYFMDHGFKHPFYILEEFTEEIRNAEKEAYGKLIRMMAHEVNNTIGSVNSIMSAVQSNPDSFKKPKQEEIISILGVAIQRNYQLNRFMQNFSNVVKLPLPDKTPLNLIESVMAVIDSFEIILKEKNIVLSTSFDEGSPEISADRSQMEQVFTNILKNSIEAVRKDGNILVSVKTNPTRIIIEDNGAGLSGEDCDRIFTPFYSTKPGGQGIGLTLVKEILSNHGFSFSLRNRESGGAVFAIKCKTGERGDQPFFQYL